MTCKDVLLFASAIGGVVLLAAGWVVVGYIDRLRSRVGAASGEPRQAEKVQPIVAVINARVNCLEGRVAALHWGAAFLLGGVAVLTWQALKPMPGSRRAGVAPIPPEVVRETGTIRSDQTGV